MSKHLGVPFFMAALSILVLSAFAVPVQAATCGPCATAQEQCFSNCFSREGKAATRACLMACDNAAAACSCDEAVTLRSEDLVLKTTALTADACHSTTTCGTAYPSCASWSGYSDCGDPTCGIYRWCPDDCESDFGCWGQALRQSSERFRVCFDANANSCTEYQRLSSVLQCGC
jgi:hypothetical protein